MAAAPVGVRALCEAALVLEPGFDPVALAPAAEAVELAPLAGVLLEVDDCECEGVTGDEALGD